MKKKLSCRFLQTITLSGIFFLFSASPSVAQKLKHPLDPLNKEEIAAAVKIIRAAPDFPKVALFSTVALNEPPKDEVLNYKAGAAFRREAFVVVFDRVNNKTYETVVDLTIKKIISWKYVPGVQPLVFLSEYDTLTPIIKADPRWQAAMRKRGITDFAKVQIDGWAVGEVDPKFTGRLLRGLSYYKGDQVNFYGRPIEGVVALVNMNTLKVVDVTDNDVLPIPPLSKEFDQKSIGKLREKPKPLLITQPKGVSFQMAGQEIRWQKWHFRYGMHPREGLVLYNIGYEDSGKVRPILYRAALSEMVVPYGDPAEDWRWRSAFDVGEYGVGRMASSLEPKLDAPENAQLLDAVFADDNGDPYTQKNVVAVYERDGGILWKHAESYTNTNESRRSRELVIFFIATIGNYDYAINYVFKQDGSMEVDLALSGIMLPKGTWEKSIDQDHKMSEMAGHLVDPNVIAPHHQHFFNFRLDFDVDGVNNTVTEMNTSAMDPGPKNPYGNGFLMQETKFNTEAEAGRSMDLEAARVWSVMNPSKKNSLGYNTSYVLVPGANSLPYIALESPVRKRAGFVNNHFWATRYNPLELYAAGNYPNQSKGGDGLPQYVANNESIANTDVVVWYTLGLTHIPRPEEWPVMPTTHIGFKMIPGGFFNHNPALDVPK